MTHPRILIISPSVFNQVSGGGVLLTNLFRGWPKENIAILHGDVLQADTRVCDQFYRVGSNEMSWVSPFNLIQPKQSPESSVITSQGRARVQTAPSLLRKLTKFILGSEMPWDTRLSTPLISWIDNFKPELIYILPGGPYMSLCLQISRKWNLPIVSHMMDDWPSVLRGGLLGPWVSRRLKRDLAQLMDSSTLCMAISKSMAAEYEKRYNKPFVEFQNPVDLDDRLPLARTTYEKTSEFKLIYVGSILPQAQLSSLADVAKAVHYLACKGMKIKFDIYSAWGRANASAIGLYPAVGVYDSLDNNSVFSALTGADVLVLPVNFDSTSLKFIKYSLPAKIPLYLASGTPVLVYGPKEAASVQYALEDEWGEVVVENKIERVVQAIMKLDAYPKLRQRRAQAGLKLARERHDAKVIRPAFQNLLCELMS